MGRVCVKPVHLGTTTWMGELAKPVPLAARPMQPGLRVALAPLERTTSFLVLSAINCVPRGPNRTSLVPAVIPVPPAPTALGIPTRVLPARLGPTVAMAPRRAILVPRDQSPTATRRLVCSVRLDTTAARAMSLASHVPLEPIVKKDLRPVRRVPQAHLRRSVREHV